MDFFQIKFMFGIVGYDKYNAIVIFILNFGWNIVNCNLWYAVDVFYQGNVILIPLSGFLYY